jgi:hypothetical protein
MKRGPKPRDRSKPTPQERAELIMQDIAHLDAVGTPASTRSVYIYNIIASHIAEAESLARLEIIGHSKGHDENT